MSIIKALNYYFISDETESITASDFAWFYTVLIALPLITVGFLLV